MKGIHRYVGKVGVKYIVLSTFHTSLGQFAIGGASQLAVGLGQCAASTLIAS